MPPILQDEIALGHISALSQNNPRGPSHPIGRMKSPYDMLTAFPCKSRKWVTHLLIYELWIMSYEWHCGSTFTDLCISSYYSWFFVSWKWFVICCTFYTWLQNFAVAGYMKDLLNIMGIELNIGVVQTAYANGASTKYIKEMLVSRKIGYQTIQMYQSYLIYNLI